MLTEAEKTHIELQEKYRAEVAGKFKPPAKINLVETTTKVLQGLAIIIGIWATYSEFKRYNNDKLEQTEKDSKQAARDFSKNIQFAYYAEAMDATSTLATEEKDTKDYTEARKKFYRLFWGRLSLVEDKCVEAKMVQFERLLRLYENNEQWTGELSDSCSNNTVAITSISQRTLQQASLRLAHSAKRYILDTWLEEPEKKNYNK